MGSTLPDLAGVLGRSITILGSTGSVGRNTLDVIRYARQHLDPDAFPLKALTAQRNVRLLASQAREFRPSFAIIGDIACLAELQDALSGSGITASAGDAALRDAALLPSDVVMSAIVGIAGLAPTLAAVERSAIVALANKECVVAAGDLLRRAVTRSGAALIPVDSEHNAAFQLMEHGEFRAIEKVTLTASGGPFLNWPLERLARATPDEAMTHPKWQMGRKISVDSATLMNKGLELIEAHILFDLPSDKLDVLIHPQSVVHCLIAFNDGSVLAHLAAPDMRTPIAFALAWPRRLASPSDRLDLESSGPLNFMRPDDVRFPCLTLARKCLQEGGVAPTVLNAANEVAVEYFLNKRIGFTDICTMVERTLDAMLRDRIVSTPNSLEDVLALDRSARKIAQEISANVAA